MSNVKTIDAHTLASLNRVLIGFDRIANARLAAMNASNYPPHNIIKYDDTHYAIEVAVAGFKKNEISIEIDQDQLTIRGERAIFVDNVVPEYIHRGLAARDFEQTFTLAEYMIVRDAEVEDGLLRISIDLIMPERLKPRKIEIK